KPLGHAIKELATIVTPQTIRQWVKAAGGESNPAQPKRKPGRPRSADEIRELILQFGRETGWGLGRIVGELKKLGIKPPCKSTIKNILKAEGLDLGPKRGVGTWDEFLKAHADTSSNAGAIAL